MSRRSDGDGDGDGTWYGSTFIADVAVFLLLRHHVLGDAFEEPGTGFFPHLAAVQRQKLCDKSHILSPQRGA